MDVIAQQAQPVQVHQERMLKGQRLHGWRHLRADEANRAEGHLAASSALEADRQGDDVAAAVDAQREVIFA